MPSDKVVKEKKPEYFLVEVESLVPTIIKYRILAKDYNEAIDLINKSNPIERPYTNINRGKKLSVKVYKWGTSIMEYIKRF